MDRKKVVQTALDIGYCMLQSGAEIYRVEESVTYICRAYGVDQIEVFAIPAVLIATARTEEGSITTIRRLRRQQINFDKVDKLNSLSRRICEEHLELTQVEKLLNEIMEKPSYTLLVQTLGFATVGFFFALLFGSSLLDAIFAMIVSVGIRLIMLVMQRQQVNPFFVLMVCGFAVAFPIQILTRFGFTSQPDAAVVGALMNLVPGVALTNGIRDFMQGDLFGGMSKMIESLLIATAIALGAAVPLALISCPDTPAAVHDSFFPIVQLVSAFVASCGFAISFEIRGKELFWSAVGGLLGWAAYLAFSPVIHSSFIRFCIAGFAIMIFSEFLARLCKAPVVVFLIVAFIPLVPGGDAYHAMEYCILGEFHLAAFTGLHMLGVAGCIVLGVFFAGSVFKFIHGFFKKGAKLTYTGD